MRRFFVKVCGITRSKDAIKAVESGADMLGFILYPKSPRFIDARTAAEIIKLLPPTIDKVGVFVNETIPTILAKAKTLQLDYIQLSGDESNKDVALLQGRGYKVIKAFHVGGMSVYKEALNSSADVVLLDNSTTDAYGGTGTNFDWSLKPPQRIKNLMLAGGINIENVRQAAGLFKPLIIDVNSGVESRPGIKSAVKLTKFLAECNRLRYGLK